MSAFHCWSTTAAKEFSNAQLAPLLPSLRWLTLDESEAVRCPKIDIGMCVAALCPVFEIMHDHITMLKIRWL